MAPVLVLAGGDGGYRGGDCLLMKGAPIRYVRRHVGADTYGVCTEYAQITVYAVYLAKKKTPVGT